MTHFAKLAFAASALFFGVQAAEAATLATITHDYGSDFGKYDPSGTDSLLPDHVIVSDQSNVRFSDVFDFSGVTGTISSLLLSLDFTGAGPSLLPAEVWSARIQGSNSGSTLDDLFVPLFDILSPQPILLIPLIDIALIDVWSHSLGTSAVEVWFSEFTTRADAFALNSITLTVYGEPSATVPVPAALPLLAGGLGVLGFMGRRKKANR